MSLPWDDLADAYDALQEAERHGSGAELEAARAGVLRAKEHCGNVGGLLLTLAMDHAGYAVQRKLFEAITSGNASTYRAAKVAVRLAKETSGVVQALSDRVKQLEEMLARQTPGVGEPGRTK